MLITRIFCLLITLFCSLLATSEEAEGEYSSSQDRGGIKLYGEFIYWQAVQDQTQFAAVLPGGVQRIIDTIEAGEPVQLTEQLSIINHSFKYKPGFRIGAAYELPYSNWDIDLSWTRLHEKISKSVSNDEGGIIPITFPASAIFGFISGDPSMFGFASQADSSWRFHFDTIDLEFKKNLCICDVALSPFIGVKAACISQTQEIEYFGFDVDGTPIVTLNKKKNKFRGIGPSAGCDIVWECYQNWKLRSGFTFALLYGKFNVGQNPSVALAPNFITFDVKNSKPHRIRPAVDANIGLDWNTCLFDRFQLEIGVAYEVQYWWNQWQPLGSIASIAAGGSSPQGDLMMQGLTARLGILF